MNKIIIPYQTRQELPNKNSLKEMNHNFRKRKHQTTKQWTIKQHPPKKNPITKTNGKSKKKIKANCKQWKDYLSNNKNIEWRTVKTEPIKINQVLPYISKNNITELNKQIYAGVILVCEKTSFSSKKHEEKTKPGGEIRLETQIKNLRKQAKL